MSKSLELFHKSIDSVNALHALHKSLSVMIPVMDLSDILRSEIVLIVSSFDCFIHDVIRQGILDIFNSKKSSDSKNDKFCIPLSFVKNILEIENENERMEYLNISIQKILSKDSYQSPTNIENALQLISVKGIWSLIKNDMGMTPDDIKRNLGVIIYRRNKIAHEADISNMVDATKNPIDRSDVDNAIHFITKLAESIDKQI